MSASRLRTCAWIETSSAATDSSRISTRGSAASARAIATRWRWPPESARGSARIWRSSRPTSSPSSRDARPPLAPGVTRRGAAAAPRRASLARSGAGRGWSTGPGRRSGPRGRGGGARAAERAGVERSRPQAVIVPAVGRVQADDHPGDRGLARPGLADDRQRAARPPPGTRRRRRRPARRTPCAGPRALEDRPRSFTQAPTRSSAQLGRPHAAHLAAGETAASSGASAAVLAQGQRGANGQPAGASNADTGRPRDRGQAVRRRRRCGPGGGQRRRVGVQRLGRAAQRTPASRRSGRRTSPHVRSHTAAASSRSWVMNSIASPRSPAQVVEDRHDLGLRRHVERGRRLVGEDAGAARSAAHAAIITRCSMPPESSCGYCASRRSPSSMPTSRRASTARCCASLRDGAPVRAQRLGHEVADRAHRVDVRARVLEDHRDLAAVVTQRIRRAAHRRRGRRSGSRPPTAAPAGSSRAIARAVIDLPEPDSPTRPTASPAPIVKRDVVQHRPHLALDGQPHGEAVDLEQRAHARRSTARPPADVEPRPRALERGADAGTRSRRRRCGRRSARPVGTPLSREARRHAQHRAAAHDVEHRRQDRSK